MSSRAIEIAEDEQVAGLILRHRGAISLDDGLKGAIWVTGIGTIVTRDEVQLGADANDQADAINGHALQAPLVLIGAVQVGLSASDDLTTGCGSTRPGQ